jgi:hypothetical protein
MTFLGGVQLALPNVVGKNEASENIISKGERFSVFPSIVMI